MQAGFGLFHAFVFTAGDGGVAPPDLIEVYAVSRIYECIVHLVQDYILWLQLRWGSNLATTPP